MAILKRILRIIRFLVLLSIALVVGVIAVLTLTQKGRENLAGLISSMASSPGSSVRIVGLSGIWSGPLKIDNLVLEDSDGAWLAARGIAIDWSPLSLLSSTFEASLVHADRVELARLPKSAMRNRTKAAGCRFHSMSTVSICPRSRWAARWPARWRRSRRKARSRPMPTRLR